MNAHHLSLMSGNGNGNDFVAAFRSQNDNATTRDDITQKLRADFARAFKKVSNDRLRGDGLGILLPYCYHDTRKESWGAPISTNAAPWDNLVGSGESYTAVPNGEVRALQIAIREGISENIPQEIHYISLGPGDTSTFKSKDMMLLDALVSSGKQLIRATTDDINGRYARQNAQAIYETYGCDTLAFRSDFLSGDFPEIPDVNSGAIPLFAIFGGTAQNMPELPELSAERHVVQLFSKIKTEFPNSHVIMSVDVTPPGVDPALAIAAYGTSLEIEMFVLNFMPAAKEHGIITDKNYDVFRNWRICQPQWEDDAVHIYIEAKHDHALKTIDGDYEIKKGDRVSVSRSRKGSLENHIEILNVAGFEEVEAYPQSQSANATLAPAKYILHAHP